MLGRPALAVACGALSASAFLLPPAATSDISLDFVAIDPKNQLLELPCSSCAFPRRKGVQTAAAEEDDDTVWIQGGANNLLLNFTISDDGRALELNKHAIYPQSLMWESLGEPWVIEQVTASTTREQLKALEYVPVPLHVTGESISTGSDKNRHDVNIVSVGWQLTELEGQAMTVDRVDIQLIQTEDGELLILSAEPVPGTAPDALELLTRPPLPHHRPEARPSKDCGPLCRFVNAMQDKIGAAKHGKFGKFGKHGGCGGRKGGRPHRLPGHIRPHFDFTGPEGGERPHLMRPHGPPGPHGPHGHHGSHGHHGHHGPHGPYFLYSFTEGLMTVLVPIVVGMLVGLAVSLLGLVVGRSISWLWINVVRRGLRGTYASIEQDEVVAEAGEIKEVPAYVEESEALPVYEDAPAYELSGEKNEL